MSKNNDFISFPASIIVRKTKGKLASINYLAKDNFWTDNLPTSASSNFLIDFVSGEDATVIKLLKKEGAFLLGKTIMDEFACGGSGLLSNQGKITNPYNPQHITGGSSSGSAVAVAKKMVSFALGSDTGGSVRNPAAHCGIIGFKPSYGLISRYGLIPMASSLDTVGILANSVSTTQKVFSVISQPDFQDLLTLASRKVKTKLATFSLDKKIAVLTGIEKYLSAPFAQLYQKTLNILKESSYTIQNIEIPQKLRENLQLTYLIIHSSELVSHLNSCQGITYGQNINHIDNNLQLTDKIKQNRSNYFGKEIKQRLLIGAYFLQNSHYLEQSYLLRQEVKKWTDQIFLQVDFLLFPSTMEEAPKINDSTFLSFGNKSHWVDNLLLLANLAGLPSLSLPIGFVNELPVAICLNGGYRSDQSLLQLADLIEKKINFNPKKKFK